MKKILVITLLGLLIANVHTCSQGQLTIDGACTSVSYIQGCVQYKSADTCALCQYGYQLGDRKCDYAEKPVTQCCVLMDNDGVCKQCAPGLILDGNSCIKTLRPGCLEGKGSQCFNCASDYLNRNGKCLKKLPRCSSYKQNGVCSACDSGFQLIGGLCVEIYSYPTSANCKQANQYGCAICKDGFYLTKGRQCQQNQVGCLKHYRQSCQICSPEYKLIKGKCTMQGCTAYNTKGCQTCSGPYTLFQGRCILDNCLDSVDGQCTVCQEDYRIKNGRCVRPIADRCNTCANGYFVGQDGRCYKFLTGCASYGGDGKCARCDDPFVLTGGFCTIPGCDRITSKGCQLCFTPFQLTNGRCIISNCDQHNYQSSRCRTCKAGYHVEQGLCVKNSQLCLSYLVKGNSEICSKCISDEYVLTESGSCEIRVPGCVYQYGKCISCSSPFKRVDGKCVIEGCGQYNLDGCIKCNQPYQEKRGACVIYNCDETLNGFCLRCASGFHLTSVGSCAENDPKCSTYRGDKCSNCISGYRLSSQGLCVREIAFCKTQTFERCDECQGGYQLVNGNCIISDKFCQNYDTKLQGCTRCSTGYHTESGVCRVNDLSCDTYGSSSFTQRCTKCSAGYVFTVDGLFCVRQVPGCIYDTQGRCSSCKAPFVYNGKGCSIYGCLKYSETGCYECQYPSLRESDKCVIPFCNNYEQATTSCRGCLGGYKLIQGKCYREDPKCIEYTKNGQCIKCVKEHALFQGVCVKEDKYCSKYSRQGGCNKCQEKYYVSPDLLCLPEEPGCVYQKGKCAYCNYPFKFHEPSQKCRIDGCLQAVSEGCTKCRYPYQKSLGGVCQIPNCSSALDNHCVRCKPGYHLKQGLTCVKDDPSCLKYNDDGDCELCDKGYMLMSSGECQLAEDNCIEKGKDSQCTACKPEYFLNKFFQCQKKDKNCQQYNNGVCVSCSRRYFLYQYICFPYSPGCVEYSGKDCTRCKSNYILRNGECFNVKRPALKLEGQDEKYDFDIIPIDITKSKYYIDNLSPISKLGKVFYSSFFSTEYTDPRLNSQNQNLFTKGWKAANARSSEYIGYTITQSQPATFYAIQIEGVEGNYIQEFYIQYSIDDVNYVRIQRVFNCEGAGKNLVTVYFTGIYAKSIRIVVKSFYGWPAGRIEFFYYDMIRFRKISNLKSLKYLKESIQSNFVDRMDNQMYINQRLYFTPTKACQNKTTCFTGLELCQQRTINSLTISVNEGSLKRVYLTYSVDGYNFNCFEKCRYFMLNDKLTENQLICNGISAKNLRVYPVEWTGTPNIKIAYDYS